ncbi:MAG: hypothetical protein Q9160_001196 [Pyrenula sp. 1 TL-2023]
MDRSAAGGQGQAHPQQQSKHSLIRPEQVRQLPHLDEDNKKKYQQAVSKLWETVRTHNQGTPEHTRAYQNLGQISQKLMADMKKHQAQQQQLQQQQRANAPSAQPQSFGEVLPIIQRRVNEYPFVFPPGTVPGSEKGTEWLEQAKMRMAQALQKNEIGKQKYNELLKELQERNQAGLPSNHPEIQAIHGKVQQCKKYINDSRNFLEKFSEQQTHFKEEHQRLSSQSRTLDGAAPGAPPGQKQLPGQVSATTQGPSAHTISSAVSAARNANAVQQTASSPNVTQAPSQPGSAITNTPQHSQAPFGNSTQNSETNAQIKMPGHPNIPHAVAPTTGTPQNFSNTNNSSTMAQPSSATSHAHPHQPNYFVGPPGGLRKDENRFAIPKTLSHVPPPVPASTGSSRPTLIGSSGQTGADPTRYTALPKMTGFVLDSGEAGHLLSKKKLDELVREVNGIDGEQLSPEVEEIFLQIADDFVDDLITASCRLAKMRRAESLDIRDVQLILERNYNIRIPGYSSDEVRTVRRNQPAPGWTQKMSAVQAAKVTGGGNISAGGIGGGPGGKDN